MLDLATQIVRDGEGAQKLIKINVRRASSAISARRIGLSIANSPLVKTAIAGEDANWGRVVMAVGKSGEKADRDKMGVWFGGIKIAENGGLVDNYDEKPVAKHMQGHEVVIDVDVGPNSIFESGFFVVIKRANTEGYCNGTGYDLRIDGDKDYHIEQGSRFSGITSSAKEQD